MPAHHRSIEESAAWQEGKSTRTCMHTCKLSLAVIIVLFRLREYRSAAGTRTAQACTRFSEAGGFEGKKVLAMRNDTELGVGQAVVHGLLRQHYSPLWVLNSHVMMGKRHNVDCRHKRGV